MANQTINKVQINGNPETYDVEDTQARQDILDLTQKTSQLKEDLDNHIGKNMCGMNPNVFYPVLLKSGDTITMSTSDGSVNDRLTNLRFYDKDKNLVAN